MGRKFVVGDDSTSFARAAFRRLRQKIQDIEVYFAETPEGLIKLAEEHPDAEVVTDLRYTDNGEEGYQVLEQLAKERAVYLWTANAGDPGVRERAMELGAADVIPKLEIVRLAGYTPEPKLEESPASDGVLILAPERVHGAVKRLLSALYSEGIGEKVRVIERGELKTVEGTYRHVIFLDDASRSGDAKSFVDHEDKYRETPIGYETVDEIKAPFELREFAKVLGKYI